MDTDDRLRLKVLLAAREEVQGFDRLLDALKELAENVELEPVLEKDAMASFVRASQHFAEARMYLLDRLVKARLPEIYERLVQ
jgi:hypothetical protein